MNNCSCETTTSGCPGGKLERPRYFPRKLITDEEMTLEQNYFRDRMRLHNRLLHGWGVVCGARVCHVEAADGSGEDLEPWMVHIEPGYLLGPYGDEIFIDSGLDVDLRTTGYCVTTGEVLTSTVRDPWCTPRQVETKAGTLYIAISYHEAMTRPVRVQPAGCGCDETPCEYSRWCDGFEVCILTECPESHRVPPEVAPLDEWNEQPIPPCPPCPEEPWVVLAKVEVSDDGTVEWIDNCSCRRLVYGFGHQWWRCKEKPKVAGDGEDEAKLAPQDELDIGRIPEGGLTEPETKPVSPAPSKKAKKAKKVKKVTRKSKASKKSPARRKSSSGR